MLLVDYDKYLIAEFYDLNPSDFCRSVMEYAASLVGALDQVAGFVVGVAVVKYGTTKVV